MDLQALRAYCAANFPEEWAAADEVAIQTIVAAMRAPAGTVDGTVSQQDIRVWAAATGMRAIIEDHANDPTSPLRSSALALKDLLVGDASGGLDLGRSEVQTMMEVWGQNGALSAADRAALVAIGQKPITRGERDGFADLGEIDVRKALWADDGTRAS